MQVAKTCASGYSASLSASQYAIGQIFLDCIAVYPGTYRNSDTRYSDTRYSDTRYP